MSEGNIFASVDIGTNTIICLIGRDGENNKLNVVGHSIVASAGVRRGAVLNIEEAVAAVQKAVEKASAQLDVKVSRLYVNVAGQHLHTIGRQLSKSIDTGKIISRADIELLCNEAKATPLDDGEMVYHVINQSYNVDGEAGIRNPIGISGSELLAEYRIVSGPASYYKALKLSLEKAGFEMVKYIVNPIAAADAVLTDDEKEAGTVLVDLGAGTTSVAVYYDNVLRHLAIIPFGGNVVTNDIREGCSIVMRQAESLKVQYGSAMGEHAPENKVVTIPGISGWEPKEISFKSLAYIIQARMEEIVESVYYQIEKSGCADRLGAGIVITGGGARLHALRQLFLFKTGMDVRVGKPINGILSENEKVIDNPQYATAFGLLKKALSNSKAQNDELIAKKRNKRPRPNYGEAFIQKLSFFFNEDQDAEF
ncbi:cell division protein FtsA [Roseimarinus sediminis]|uniref:cell division protein FtsA n=1 Tax=Roseimarinus sediminis TaxID=1610899 RepID=UPI003D259DB1